MFKPWKRKEAAPKRPKWVQGMECCTRLWRQCRECPYSEAGRRTRSCEADMTQDMIAGCTERIMGD